MSHSILQLLGNFLPFQSSRRKSSASLGALALAFLVPALMVLSACASGYHGLPTGITIPKAAGLTITAPPPNPSNGVVGQPYTTIVTFTGGLAPYTCTASGLPPGLTLSGGGTSQTVAVSPCTITGTPTMQGMFTVSFTVTDSSQPVQSVPDSFTITINSPFGFATFAPGAGEVGVAYSQTFTAAGGIGNLTSCSLAPAVPGLMTSFAGNTCTLSGTPTGTFGPMMVTITAKDTGAPPTTPQSTTMQMANLTIFAHVAVPGFTFPEGEVGSAYSLTIPTTGGVPPMSMCAIPGLPNGLNVATMGVNCVVSGTPTVAFGPTMLTLTVMDSATAPPNTPAPVSASNAASLTVAPMLAVSNFTFTTGEVGSPYNLTITTTNGIPPLTACMFTPPLPAGLIVTPTGATCVVSGTPTVAFGPTSLTLTATDTGSTASTPATAMNAASLTINAQLAIPAFTLGNGEVGAVYSQTIPTTGGILPLTACSFAPPLPAGLMVVPNAANCVVSGTPTAAFPATTMTLSATDTGSADSTKFTAMTASTNMFQVFSALALANTLGNGEVGAPYSSTNAGATEPLISGGNSAATSYTCAFMGPAPAGLAVAWNGLTGATAGCTVMGSPTAVFASATVSIMVTEAPAPSTSSAAGTVTVASNAIQIFAALKIVVTLGNGEINAPYSSANLGATEPAITPGNPAATSYACVLTGAPPIGLAAAWNNVTGANAGCTVSGTPTALFGPAPVTVQVTESPAPSPYSAAGVASGASGNIQIYSALSLAATLGNGEVNALYSSTNAGATEPAISGGNPASTTYACAFTGASPAGLAAAWNGTTGAAAGCTVSGTPTAVFGPATTMIKVTDMTPSPYSAAGSFTATSNPIQIFPQVTLAAFALGAGETGAGYSHANIAINPGITPAVTYTCTSATLPAGLAASAAGAFCQVTGTPTATFAAPVTIMVTENIAPSPYSAAGSNSTTSTGNLVIQAGITFNTFNLGDGVVGFAFNQNPAPGFSGGNTAAAYTCTLPATNPAPLPDGLTATWNGTAPPGAAACNVTGTPTTAIPPPGVTVLIQVQDTPLSADQTTPSTAVASSQPNFEINAALTIVNPTQVNDLVNVPYPGITFTAKGGLSLGTNVTWTAPGNISASGLCAPPAGPAPLTGLPPGLTLNTSTGAITGTPTTVGIYTFEVCVEDNPGAATTSTNPQGLIDPVAVTIKILGHLAFASGTADSTVQVIDVSTNTFVQSIPLPAGAVPAGIALNAEGGFAFVADKANNTIIPIDTVALTAGAPVPLPPTCAAPSDLAATPNQTKPGHNRLYVACTGGSFDIVVFDISAPATPVQILDFPQGISTAGVAIQGDNARAYVMVNSPCAPGPGYYVFDNTTNPPTVIAGICLSGTSTQATELAVVSNNGNNYLYISKQSPPAVEVDNVTVLANPSAPATVIAEPSNPDALASDPLQSHVYVTLPGTNQFDVLDNTVATPVQLTGSPFGLPNPPAPGTDSAGGVTVPPNTSGTFPFSAYFTVPTTSVVDVTDDSGAEPPVPGEITKDPASPITGLTGGSTPRRIASIPIPDAGLGLSTRAVPNAIANRMYTVYAVIRGGSAPYTCSASGLPAGLTVGPNAVAVPSGPLSGRQACQISGTAPGAGTSAVDVTVTDNSAPPLMSSAGYTLTIRPEFAFSAPTALPNGVVGRTYGAPAGTSPVETTTVSATVGNSPLVTCALSGAGGNLVALTAAVSGTANCALSSGGANLVAAETDNLTFSATDTPITDPFTMILAVPANTISTASTVALVVQPALMITSAFTPPAWTVNATNPYPTQMVTVSGGIQASLACMLTGYTSGLMVTPSPGVCALNGDPTLVTAGTMITITVSDAGNTAVPPATVMPKVSGTIVVNAQAALTTLEAAFADGVENRAYSVTANASGGTGNLTLSSTGLNAANCAGLTLSSVASPSPVSGTVMGTPTVALVGNATASCMFSLTVTDTTNTATTTNYTATIHAPLVLSFAPNPGFGVGVSGQPFSQTLTATGGLQPVTACTTMGVPASLTTSFTATTCKLSGTPLVGDQGTTAAMITVTDTADSATAAGMGTASSALTINPPLAITPPARIINALSGFAYPSASTPAAAVTYSATAGTGTGSAATFTVAANAAGAVCGAQGSAGTFPMGTLTFTNQTGTSAELTGTPTSATSALYSFPICAVDSGSVSTAAYAVNTATSVNLAVLSPSAYAAASGSKTVEAFSTSLAATPNAPIASISVTGTPQAVAVTPDGRYVIVTEQTPDQVDVIDATTNTALANSPFALPNNCGTPVGVAADAQFVYIACDSTAAPNVEEVLVLDEVMLTTGGGGGGALSVTTQIVTGVGSAPDSVAFNTADTRADVTLSGLNQIMIIDNTAAPPAPIAVTQTGNPQGVFNLPVTSTTPREIAVLQNTASGTKDYAFIAKQNTGAGTGITFVSASSDPSCTNSNNGKKTVSCLFAISANDTVVVMVGHPTGVTVNAIGDDGAAGGNTYTRLAGCSSNNSTTAVIDCYTTAAGATETATTITVTLAANSQFTVSAAEYSGVTAIGHTAVNNTYTGATTTTNPSVMLTTQDANNVCVAGFLENATEAITSGGAGITVQTQVSDTAQIGAILDFTQAVAGACTVSATVTPTAHTWAVGAVELRNTSTAAGVDVVDVTSDPSGGTPALTIVTSIPEPGPSTPFGVAGTASGRAYITLQGSGQFDVLDNTVAVPKQIAGAPFNLPDPTMGAAPVMPVGVVIPPFLAAPFQAYITFSATGEVGIIDDGTPPTADAASPVSLTGGAASGPGRVAAIPVPH